MASRDWFTQQRSGRILQVQFQGSYATAIYYFATSPQSIFRSVGALLGLVKRGDIVYIGGEWIEADASESETETAEENGQSTPVTESPSQLGPSGSNMDQSSQQSASVSDRYQPATRSDVPRIIESPPESVLSEVDQRGYVYHGIAAAIVDRPVESLNLCRLSEVFDTIPQELTDDMTWTPDVTRDTPLWKPPTLQSADSE